MRKNGDLSVPIDPDDKAEYDSPAYDESYDPYEHCYKCPNFDTCEDGPLTEMECETLQTLRRQDLKRHFFDPQD